jgi:urea transporter
MRRPTVEAIALLAIAVFIEVASLVQAIRQGSWAPMYTTGWVPVVVLASYHTTYVKGCGRRLRGRAGAR